MKILAALQKEFDIRRDWMNVLASDLLDKRVNG